MPRNKYPEETINKILEVSLKLFLEKGFEQTTVLDIVNNLGGLTRGAFYHHFKSKDEVLEAIFKKDFSESNPFQKANEAKVANGLERARLALKYGFLANIENENQKAASNLAVSLISNPRFLAELMKSNQELAQLFTPIITEGMADGSIKSGDAKVTADLFILLINLWLLPTVFPCNKEENLMKIKLIRKVFDGLGFPVIDNEIEEIYYRMFDSVNW